ncbi:conjugal transfer protein TraD [Chryseobacterium indoltheticum]|uniref:Conjugal transfer protein TraD n=1 Tax=Chryseobacterium indoltheticum TaxID=254 RepID=A0A381FQW8_9FLAO|nr:conjugal transfer protein TraD [Chryseobacterium indoltheticum]SUX48950.1 Uncharacterised protein [Chryseobacterium indoltheticum]
MEILIILSLLIIIALLLQDKIVFQKKSDEKSKPKLPEKSLSIMGESKKVEMHLQPKHSDENAMGNQQTQISNFDQEINDKKVDIQIPQEELDDVFGSTPDFEEEEEEWSQYLIFDNDNGSATGVTFEELNSVETFLKEQKLEVSHKETATHIIQKIQGTELFNLLENSIEGASIKIAELLDKSLSSENNSDSSIILIKDFNIGDFT